MALSDADLPLDDAAALAAALAHPVRMAILRLLRARRTMPLADLRRDLEPLVGAYDTRTVQHHVARMRDAGIVDVERLGPRYRVHLVRDVAFKVRGA